MRKALVVAVPFVIAACAEPTSVGSPSFDFGLRTVWSSAAPSVVVPAGYDVVMGASNNAVPHSWGGVRYQQVFEGANLNDPILVGLCLRRDELPGGNERTQTLAIKLGPTSLNHSNIGTTFDANYTATPTSVFAGDVLVPAPPGGGTPADFDLCIPFTQSYEHVPGTNVILEVVNTSAFSSSGFAPRDGCTSAEEACTTARVYAFSPTATIATISQRQGLILKFISPEPARSVDPVEKDECLKGGWSNFSFRNQGQCVRFVETGEDSRTDVAL